MIKKINKDNALFKRKNLVLRLKKSGVQRVSPEAILSLERYFKENLDEIISGLNEEMTIQGRKTLKKKDVLEVFKNLEKKDDFIEI